MRRESTRSAVRELQIADAVLGAAGYFEEIGFDLVAPLDVNLIAGSRVIEMDVLYRRRNAA